MSDEVLIPEDDRRPVAAIFGKLPATGDFVWRGLPEAFRKHWDLWITRHIVPLERAGGSYPPGGLRFSLPSGGRLAAGVILPSQDKAGRRFPLTLMLIAEGAMALDQIDVWCDAAVALGPENLSPDDLWIGLDALPAPETGGPANGRMQVWTPGGSPVPTDPADPDVALGTLMQV